jgi:hypothetical protein
VAWSQVCMVNDWFMFFWQEKHQILDLNYIPIRSQVKIQESLLFGDRKRGFGWNVPLTQSIATTLWKSSVAMENYPFVGDCPNFKLTLIVFFNCHVWLLDGKNKWSHSKDWVLALLQQVGMRMGWVPLPPLMFENQCFPRSSCFFIILLVLSREWEWGMGWLLIVICGSFPHSLLSTSK